MKKKKYYYIFKEEQLDRMNVEYNKNDENTNIWIKRVQRVKNDYHSIVALHEQTEKNYAPFFGKYQREKNGVLIERWINAQVL